MPTLAVDGTEIHYEEEGKPGAPVLVLSNSLGADLAMWDAQMAALSRRFRVVRYDTRGHGGSAVTPGPYRIGQLGEDVLGLLEGLGIKRFRFCGLSLGGIIGMWLGIHAPQRVERLALANTAARIGTPETWNARIDKVREAGVPAISHAVLRRWLSAAFIASHADEAERMLRMMEAVPAEGYVACCAAVRDADFRAQLASITAPTLVIAGTHDVSATPADGRSLAAAIGGSRYVELPAAHISNVEAPGEFTAALLEFMTE